jgi:hypothetical protein
MESDSKNSISRRKFLKASAITVAAAGSSTLSGNASEMPANQNKTTSVSRGNSASNRVSVHGNKNRGFIKNLDLIGYHDLNNKMGFQMAYYVANGKHYLYSACFRHPGWHILDVTDPSDIRYCKWLECPDADKNPGQICCKIQVADGLMLTTLSGGVPFLNGTKESDSYMEGLLIWDIKTDPENPKLLSYWSTGVPDGFGVHRFFYNGGRYAHLAASCRGYSAMIYRVLDIQDPTKPVEIGRWWLPEQWRAGKPAEKDASNLPFLSMDQVGLHGPAYIKGDKAYLGYGGGGGVILDVSDLTLPKFLGRLPLSPPFSYGGLAGARCHTFLPLTSRNFGVLTNEGERFSCFNKNIIESYPPQAMGNLHMVDFRDPEHPTLVAEFPYPEVPEDWPWEDFNDCGIGAPGPLGPHNIHEPHDLPFLEDNPNRVYCCYFHCGLRVYNVTNPYRPKEIAYFIPPAPEKWQFHDYPGPKLGITEDIVVDKRGYIFVDTFHGGIYVLKLKDGIE